MRRRFDPLASEVPAHITLVFPFESDISTAGLGAHVRDATAGRAPFGVGFGDVIGSDDHFMFLGITEGAAAITDLHARLYTGPLRPFLAAGRQFVPHLTIGRFADAGALEAAMREVRGVEFGPGTTANAVTSYRIEQARREVEFEHSLG